jgi:hypothetical protein
MKRLSACLVLVLIAGCTRKHKDEDTRPERSPQEGVRAMVPAVDRAVVQNQLKNIHIAYMTYSLENNRPPKRIEDLKSYCDPKVVAAIKQGDIVVTPGVDLSRQQGNPVLAYQNKPDAQGRRSVLRCDGTVQLMTAEEFEAAPMPRGGKPKPVGRG